MSIYRYIDPPEDVHHLQKIFWAHGFKHPTWFALIVERIARRRFVWPETIERIADWYCEKYGYCFGDLQQHSGRRIDWRRGEPWEMVGQIKGPYCPVERGGHPIMGEQRCFICSDAAPLVVGDVSRLTVVCSRPVCRLIYQFFRIRFGGKGYWHYSEDRRPIYFATIYLKYLLGRLRDARRAPA